MSGALSTPKLLERAHVRAIGLRLVPAFPECETATKLLHADVRPVINGWITVRSFQSLTRRSRASRTTPGRSSQTKWPAPSMTWTAAAGPMAWAVSVDAATGIGLPAP